MEAIKALNEWVQSNTSNFAVLEVIEMWIFNRSSKQQQRIINKFYGAALRNLQHRYDETESRHAISEVEGRINEFRRPLGDDFEEELTYAYLDYAWEPLWNQIATRIRRNRNLGALMVKLQQILTMKDLWPENLGGLNASQRRSVIRALENIEEPDSGNLTFDDLVAAGVYYEIPWNKTDGRKQQLYFCTQGWDEEDIWELMSTKAHFCDQCGKSFISAYELREHQDTCGLIDIQRPSIDSDDFVVFEPDNTEASMKLRKIVSELKGDIKIQDNYLGKGILTLLNDLIPSNVGIKLLTRVDEGLLKKQNNFDDRNRLKLLAKGLETMRIQHPNTELRATGGDRFHDRFIICKTHGWISSTSLKDLGNEKKGKLSIMFKLPEQVRARVEEVFEEIWNDPDTRNKNPDDIKHLVEKYERRGHR
jgi:hypothetical protein